MDLQGFAFTIVHRGNKMLEDANYLSRISQDIHIDPLLADYEKSIQKLRGNRSSPSGSINKQNLPGRRTKHDSPDEIVPPRLYASKSLLSCINFACIEEDFTESKAMAWDFEMEKHGFLCLCLLLRT